MRRFLMRLVGERFAGFIDFDSAGKKRRLFFDEGRVFNAQSTVAGENLCEVLVSQRRLNAEQQKAALQLAREKKIALENALIELGALDDRRANYALADLSELVIKRLVGEARSSYKLTNKPGLRGRMLGNLVELLPLISVQDDLRDPNVREKTDPAAGAKAEIKKAFEKLKDATHYDVLEVPESASPDTLRKSYFDLAKRWHADRFPGVDLGDAKEMLDTIFAAVGDAYATLNDPAKRADYDAILDRKRKGLPTDVGQIMEAEVIFKKGDALLTRGEHDLALKELEDARKMNPGEAEFHAVYGLALYLAKHDTKPAIAAAQKALEINPKLARAHEVLGRIYKGENELQKAKNHFDKCLAINPKNVNAQRELRLMAMRKDSDKHNAVKREEGGLLSKLFKR